jgi:hypothetical protein
MEKAQIAGVIFRQLGGEKFQAMTGAKDLRVIDPIGLGFRLPWATAKNGISFVSVYLTPMDDYTVTFLKEGIRGGMVSTHDGVYADMLQELFTEVTGLDTHL